MFPRRRSAAFTLIELLLVLAVLGVLIGVAMPRSEPSLYEQLRASARLLGAELAYARSLAVDNNSTYRVTFDVTSNRLVLEHSGSNSTLNKLPQTAFHLPGDPPNQHIVNLSDLPNLGMAVQLVGAAVGTSSYQYAASVEFRSLGETTSASPTTIWLSVGSGEMRHFITLTIDPITGIASVGIPTCQAPPPVVPLSDTAALVP